MRGGAWIIAEAVGTLAISFAAMLALARLLTPEAFGLAGLVLGAMLVGNVLVEWLLHDALIQSPSVDDAMFARALWLVEGMALALLAVAAGAAVLAIEAVPGSGWLLVAAFAALPPAGVTGTLNARERRAFSYGRVAMAALLGRLGGALAGLCLAMAGYGALSLVLVYTLGAALQAALLASLTRWLPAPRLDFAPLRPLLRFALPNLVTQLLVAARLQVLLTLVAAMAGLAVAGYLNLGLRLAVTPQMAAMAALLSYGLPLLSRAGPELVPAYLRVSRAAACLCLPGFVGLALVADRLVPLALGPGWEQVVVPMQVLSLGAALALLRFPGGILARARGGIRYSLYDAALQLGLVAAALLLLQPQDAGTAAAIWVAPLLLVAPATLAVVARRGVTLTAQWRALLPPLAGTACMAAALLLWARYAALPPMLDVPARVLVGAAIFGAVTAAWSRR